MKIRVDFTSYDGDGLQDLEDLESSFDVVELQTVYAGTYEAWADAVWDFVSTAGTRWDHAWIIQQACLIEGGENVKNWDRFVKLLSDEAKKELRAALDSWTEQNIPEVAPEDTGD